MPRCSSAIKALVLGCCAAAAATPVPAGNGQQPPSAVSSWRDAGWVAAGSAEPGGGPTLLAVGYDLSWRTIDCGGGGVSGGGFTLDGTLGQPDAVDSWGDGFTFDGGYWPIPHRIVFQDGFEGGDATRWSTVSGGPSPRSATP